MGTDQIVAAMGKNRKVRSSVKICYKSPEAGAQWRELSEVYDTWQLVYVRLAKWRNNSTLERVFFRLFKNAGIEKLAMDST